MFLNADVAKAAAERLSAGDAPDWEQSLYRFMLDWLDNSPTISLWSSGTTGEPKRMTVEKKRMAASAQMTGRALSLKPGDRALLCLPADYIAGKMMAVRAFVLGLDLEWVRPSLNPLADFSGCVDFCAMTPAQLRETLEFGFLDRIRTLIVGGAPVAPELAEQVRNSKTRIIETYGMSETLSHVAFRALSGPRLNDRFTALEGIRFRCDERGCLIVLAPEICDKPVVTNDLVELRDEFTFRLLGRADHIINSGGIKIIPEQVERILAPLMNGIPFFIAGVSDARFGERPVLYIEAEATDMKPEDFAGHLKPAERPVRICAVPAFTRTGSGKVSRAATLKRAAEGGVR